MTNQRLIDDYLTRAAGLEDCVRRLQKNPSALGASPRAVEMLRREAAWWRGYAQQLARAA